MPPKVHDRQGQEIEWGARVQLQNWGDGTFVGFVTVSANGAGHGTAFVRLDDERGGMLAMKWRALPLDCPGSYYCPDLRLPAAFPSTDSEGQD